jgi:hypothetical protein
MGTTKGQTNHNKYIGITEIAIRFFYKREYKTISISAGYSGLLSPPQVFTYNDK